jgi:hypothetical protein
MSSFGEQLLFFFALFVAALYAYATLKLLFKFRAPVRQQYAPWDGGEPPLSDAARDKLEAAAGALAAIGFRRHGFISHTRPDNASAVGEVLDLPDGTTLAAAMAVVKGARPLRPRAITTFTTEFSDGTRLGTTNTLLNYPMRKNPRAVGYRFPLIDDPGRLFALHRALVSRHGGAIAPRQVGANASRFFGDRVDEEWARQHALGMVTVTAGDLYRPTIAGALLMAWRMMPPSASVMRFIAALKSDRLARELESHHEQQSYAVRARHDN